MTQLHIGPTTRYWARKGRSGHHEPRAAVEGQSALRCRRDTGIVRYGIRLWADTSGIADPPGSVLREAKIDPVRSFRTPKVQLDCVPGTRGYHMRSSFVTLGGSVGAYGGQRGFRMDCNEAGMWRHRAWSSATPRRPSEVLASKLGPRNRRGLAAHHIIPAYESRAGAWLVQGRGYACRIRPNEAMNGLYIPVRIHRKMHNRRHFEWLYRKFDSAMGRNGACNYQRAREILRDVKSALATHHFPGSHGP